MKPIVVNRSIFYLIFCIKPIWKSYQQNVSIILRSIPQNCSAKNQCDGVLCHFRVGALFCSEHSFPYLTLKQKRIGILLNENGISQSKKWILFSHTHKTYTYYILFCFPIFRMFKIILPWIKQFSALFSLCYLWIISFFKIVFNFTITHILK